ncbi:MAG TPA: DNA repair protein RadC [Candidatus Latescibacteria bacterium]|nr:DNA repair protein RadC [Candidatus Latescibacterota bacterium]HOS64747.1 DNA repair protein RadC [Candidatus Latescibacterota bacterium]HPK73585.1 DNA repair protein RadC [Candidatus Latescibacterota bacterium]
MPRNNQSATKGGAGPDGRHTPEIDPPMKQLERLGPSGLSDGDLLALVLDSEGDTIKAAHTIAEEYPLERLVVLPWEEISRVPGITPQSAARLAAAVELAKRGLERGLGGLPKIARPSDVMKVAPELREAKQEHFVCLYLNARTQLIHKTTISVGTLSGTLVHPREVFAPALEHSASAVIVVHNHPSGDPTPSRDDLALTHRLVEAGLIMGIEVIDHIIVGRDTWVSLKQTGEL